SSSPTRTYANVLNASRRRGESTRARIPGSSASTCATMPPIGSSTSGIQTSSIDMPGRLAPAHPPRDLRGDGDHQHAEQPAERMLGQRLGKDDAALDSAERGDADHERGPPAHVAV